MLALLPGNQVVYRQALPAAEDQPRLERQRWMEIAIGNGRLHDILAKSRLNFGRMKGVASTAIARNKFANKIELT